jgi:hypothetical protein
VKKAAVILLLLIYGSSTAGATVHLHYCMNEFVGWSLLAEQNGTCGKCGMEEDESEGCCKNEHRHFQLKTDHQKTSEVHLPDLAFSPLARLTDNNSGLFIAVLINERYPLCHAPPGVRSASLHILNCLFRV